CDDADPNINPGVPDPCGGEDLNCDGITDCASLDCLVKDPGHPGENPVDEGVKLDFYVSKPFKELISTIDDPDMLVFDPNRNAYGFNAEGLNPGIYELKVSNADSDPNQWQYRPLKKALTLKAGANRKDIDLVRIPEGAKPKNLRVEVHTYADDLFLTLKKLVLDPNQGILKEKLIQTEALSKSDPNQSFQQDFILFEDANYRILAQAKGYRGEKRDIYVDGDTNVALTIDQAAFPSLSVIKSDIDDGMIALTFSYRDATGVKGEWTDANHSSIMGLDITFFDPNDDVNGDGRPDDPNRSAGGLHVTQTDMEKVPDPGDPSKITRLRYPVDGIFNYMTFVKRETAGDPNSYVIAFLMELSDPNSRHLLGPVLRVFKIPEVLPPVGERPIAEVVDTLLGAEILSMGAIPIEGKLQLGGQSKPVQASFEASAIDPAFLIHVDENGEAEGSADSTKPLELRIDYAPDPADGDVTVVKIEIRDSEGNPVEYNPPVRDPDAPPIILEIPLIGSLQPPTAFSDAVQKAVIKFSRFGRVEIFEPSDGEDIEFYISEAGLYMARVITKHTSEWYTVTPIAVPLNFSVTTEGMGPGQVKISWVPNPENTLDLEKYQVYYSHSPDVTADPSNFSKDIPAGESSVTIDDLSDQAIYYFILVAVDSSGAMSPQTDVKYAIPGVGYATQELHSGMDVEDYRIITFPVFPDDPDPSSPENLLDDLDESVYKTAWRLFGWGTDDLSKEGDYNEFPKIGNIMPSKAFFLITKEKDIVIDIPGRPVQSSYSYEIRYGWNMIGSPYPFDISWQDVLDDPNNAAIKGQLYGGDPNDANNDDYKMPKLYAFDPEFSDSYYRYETDVMEAGMGYWVKNKGEDASLHFEPKAYSYELPRLYRPVGTSSELPPGLPGAAGQDVSGTRGGGCFVSSIDEKGGNHGNIFFSLLILGFLAFAVFIGISLAGRPKDGMRRHAVCFFLLSLGLSVSLFAGYAAAAGEVTTYIEARNAFRAGDYEKAVEGFNRVLAVYPKHAYAQKDLGLTLIFLKRPNEALDALKKAMTLSPNTRLSLEARQAAAFILGQMRSPLQQSFTSGYIYDDNVTLYPEDELTPTGRWASIGHVRYRPQLSYHIPGMKGLNSISLGYMYDYRFYDRIEERDLEIHLFMGTWRYSAGHFRLTFLTNYHSSHLHYARYTTGPGIGVRWAYDLNYRTMFELGCGYDWQTRVPDRSKDKEILKGSASLRFYSPTRRGYLELDYQLRDDKEKELTDLTKKEELTSGTTHQYTMSLLIPKSFIIPFGYITYQGDWSSHMDKHTVIYSVKEFEWYRFQALGGDHREDKTFTYEFRHIQNLYRKRINHKRRIDVNMELKYTYRSNDSDIDEISPGIGISRDYHKNVFAVGLTCKF
ncbi:MAG: hypothetical protein ACMUIM_05295, partial [bacterium]